MKKIVRLTESDLTKIIKRVIMEEEGMMDVSSDSEYYEMQKNEVSIPRNNLRMVVNIAKRWCEGKDTLPDCKEVNRMSYKHFLN